MIPHLRKNTSGRQKQNMHIYLPGKTQTELKIICRPVTESWNYEGLAFLYT